MTLQARLSAEELWTPALVKAALVEAYAVYRDSVGRVGPRGNKAFWPDYYREWGDLIAQAEIGGNEVAKRRRRRSSEEIAQADMVLLGWTDTAGLVRPAWLNGPVTEYERARKCLVAWVMAKHHGVTETALCLRAGWPRATFKRHKDFGANHIANWLNQIGVPVWTAASRQSNRHQQSSGQQQERRTLHGLAAE